MRNKIYFASDFHLIARSSIQSKEREERVIRWLDSIKEDAKTIYLLGDLFDFWHEYKTVVPKGFVRFLGKLAELSDAGIEIIIFTGNHDLWMFGYLEQEIGISVYKNPVTTQLGNHTFMIGHGDGLCAQEKYYKLLRWGFHHPFFQFLFRWVHPDIGMFLAHKWSSHSRNKHPVSDQTFIEDKEWLLHYCKEQIEKQSIDFFIFGHRHLPIDYKLNEQGSRYINLGEWISQNHFAEYDGNHLYLREFID